MNYLRFFAMITTSTLVMFALMYFNTYLFEHIFWSETRVYMAFVMGAAMAIVMLLYMLSMYRNKALNGAILVVSACIFSGGLWLVRSQATVEDSSFMSAMIPHHSIAIMTSSRANLSDVRVRKLADEIVYAQDKEIAEMRYLLADIAASGKKTEPKAEPAAFVVNADEALSSEYIPTVDPQFLKPEEISQLFGAEPICSFAYTRDSRPVLAIADQQALLKISGDLLRLAVDRSSVSEGGRYTAPGLVTALKPVEGNRLEDLPAGKKQMVDMVLELEQGLTAGYRGFYACETGSAGQS